MPAVYRPGIAALYRQEVNVAEQVERDRAAVGTYIEAHPRAARGADGDLPGIARRRVYVPVVPVVLVAILFRGKSERTKEGDTAGNNLTGMCHAAGIQSWRRDGVIEPAQAVRVRSSPAWRSVHRRSLPHSSADA